MSPNPLVFYNATVCPYAHRTWLALEEKKLPYKAIEIDLQNKPQVSFRAASMLRRDLQTDVTCSRCCDWHLHGAGGFSMCSLCMGKASRNAPACAVTAVV
jgi:hypothetical protein